MPPLNELPKRWIADDIGAVGQPGSAISLNGKITVIGSGGDIWDNADAFQFVYQPLHGDGTITARVESISDGDGWEKTGVMIRQSAAPESPHVFMAITRDQGAAFQRRASAGGSSDYTAGPGLHAPSWVRLARKGNLFEAFASGDGKSWTKVGDAQIDMKDEVLAGLAVTAHNNNASCTATFANIEVR